MGLLTLIKRGFFEGNLLNINAIHRGNGELYKAFLALRSENINVAYCDENKSLTLWAILKAFFLLIFSLFRFKPDVLILSLPQACMVGLFISFFCPKMKVAVFIHSTRYTKKIYEALLKILTKRADIFLYDTKETEKIVKAKFDAQAKEWLHVPLVFLEEVAPKQDYHVKTGFDVVSIGRLNSVKNYRSSIRAIQLLKEKGHHARLFIAGEGGDKGDLESLVQQLNLTENIIFLGFVEDWQSLMHDKDCYLLASQHEGLSIATLEAMSAALPVAATSVGGIKDYGVDGENLFIIDGFDEYAIAAALETLIGDASLRERIGKNARKTALEYYGEEATKQALEHAKGVMFN